jgi:DNA-binding transcriptional LysR family regulator
MASRSPRSWRFATLGRTISDERTEALTSQAPRVRGMVAQGLGVSLLITRPASDLTYDGAALVCRPLSDELPTQRLVMAQSHHFSPTPVAEAVMAEIRAMFDDRQTN